MKKHPQSSLALVLQKSFTFDTFEPLENTENIALLKSLADGDRTYLIWYCWGQSSSGKTHLMQAVCERSRFNNINSFYLNLNNKQITTESLEGLEFFDIVCLDGLDYVVSSEDWQEALFHLINRLMAQNKVLLISANKNIKDHQISLPDLASRLAWGLNINIKEIKDTHKPALLTVKAKQIGFKLSKNVALYLINYYSSDLKRLIKLLELVNEQALSERKLDITIPFVKKVLA